MARLLVGLVRLLLPVMAVYAALGDTRPAHACTCGFSMPQAAFEQADAVFIGRVVTIEAPFGRPVLRPAFPFVGLTPADNAYATFTTAGVWKGQPFKTYVVRVVNPAVAVCGPRLEPGGSYLVYARSAQDGSAVAVCGRLLDLPGAQRELAQLGPGGPPQLNSSNLPTQQTAPLLITLAALATLLAAAALVLSLRRTQADAATAYLV